MARKKSRKRSRKNPKRSHGKRRGHHGGKRKNPGRRRRRHRNPMGNAGGAIIAVVGGIAAGLAGSAALSYLPASGTVRNVVRGAVGVAAVLGGLYLGHPLLGVGAGVAFAYPTVRDTLRQIPGLEALPVGDDQIGAVHRLRGVHPPQLRAVHPPQVRGVG